MDIKKVIYSAPPRVSSRIIAAILALILSLVGARIFASINFGSDSDNSDENGENIEQTGKENENSGANGQTDHFNTSGAASVGTVINAKNAVLCTLEDSTIVAQKEMQVQIALKDATVFMVALTVSKAVSEGRAALTDEAVCPASAATSAGYSLSAQVLPIGKRMQVGDILKCMLYQSGTSYAYTLAVHISGSVEAFTDEMSKYALALGITSGSFTSCLGENDSSAMLSVYDFAIIMKYFLSDTYLRGIFCSNDMITVGYSQNSSIELVVKNDFFESFCSDGQAASDGVIGGKICKQGYLKWGCVVFVKNSKMYVSAVFESEEPFSDALMLYSAYALCV